LKHRTQIAFLGLYGGQFALLGIQLPFLSGWLANIGFSVNLIGYITGAALILRMVSGPIIGVLADQKFSQRSVIQVVCGVMLISALGLATVPFPHAIGMLTIILLVAFGILIPLCDIALTRAEQDGLVNFGFVRAFGSAVFILANIVSGMIIDRFDYSIAIFALAGAALLTFASSISIPRFSTPPAKGAFKPSLIVRLMENWTFVVFLISIAVIQASHATYYAFSILHWSSIGISPTIVGFLWAAGVVVEVIVLSQFRKIVVHLTPSTLIAMGGAGAMVRWAIIAIQPPLLILFLVQGLHALTFAATYLGMIQFLRRAISSEASNTAMTISSTVSTGAAIGVVTILAGILYSNFGAFEAYMAMSILGLIGFVGGILLARRWDGNALSIRPV